MDKKDSPIQVVQCKSAGTDEFVQLNVGRVPCAPNQTPLLKWCSQKEEEAPTCGECVKPETR